MMRLFPRLFSVRQLPDGLLFAVLCLALASVGSVEAATLVVTSTADSGAGSLRDTISAASDGDTIQFDAALNGQTITLTSAELVIDRNITITGPGSDLLAVSRPSDVGRFRIFHIMPGHTVTIEGLTIQGGFADASGGGGIFNQQATLTVNNCAVLGNVSDSGEGGGGIYSPGGMLTVVNSIVRLNRAGFTFGTPFGYGAGIRGGPLTIIHSTISSNRADLIGGGIFGGGTIIDSTISGNVAGSEISGSGLGGGIYGVGTLEIRNSTISGNSAMGKNSGLGGGIYGGATLTISNSTLSSNFAHQDGGGIANFGPLTITNTTLSANQTNGVGAGIANDGSNAALEIANTILSDSGTNIGNLNGGTVTSLGYNLSTDNAAGFLTAAGDQINTNPILGPLQDNGGPTFTHDLLAGSPALNAGDPNFTPPPFDDQRGYARIFSGRIDIGSLEVQPAPTPTPTPTPTATVTPPVTPTPTPSATITPPGTPTPTPTGTPTASPTPSPGPPRASNISTRLRVELGDRVMIGGFIINGGVSKKVAVRGIGPSLTGLGISGALSDPTLELRDASGALLFQNDNWQDDPTQAAQLTTMGLAPQNANESGIVATLSPGAYTATVAGKNQTTGIGLVEVYDADSAAASQLANISTRGFVQTGDNVMIGGFILGGSNQNTGIVVRGIGPSLSQFGLGNVLADPTLELRDSNGTLLIANDNWQEDPASAAQLTARGLAPQNPFESGIYASLPPGAFTAILAGKNSGTGIGLIEIYNVQ
jgi:hypothetical protein